MEVMASIMVPVMMATFAVVVAYQIESVGKQLSSLVSVIPIFAAFQAIKVFVGQGAGELARLDPAATRALMFSGATRNFPRRVAARTGASTGVVTGCGGRGGPDSRRTRRHGDLRLCDPPACPDGRTRSSRMIRRKPNPPNDFRDGFHPDVSADREELSLFGARPDRVCDFPFWSGRARSRPLKGAGAQFRWPDKD